MGEAAIQLGQEAFSGRSQNRFGLEEAAAGLADWQTRNSEPGRIQIDAEPLLGTLFSGERVFSPSELETYAACPFRYFGERVLGLQERDSDRTRWDYGSLVHRVL